MSAGGRIPGRQIDPEELTDGKYLLTVTSGVVSITIARIPVLLEVGGTDANVPANTPVGTLIFRKV